MDSSATDDVAARKRSVRRLALEARAALPSGELERAGTTTAAAVLALPALRRAKVVAAYVSIDLEIPTTPLIDGLKARGIAVLLPVTEADNSLSWSELVDFADLVRGRHGLLEPPATAVRRDLRDADAVVVPGLRYSESGARLGRGGGSYDRALRQLPRTAAIVGTALEADVVAELPVEAHDVPVDIIVTPERVITIEDGGR